MWINLKWSHFWAPYCKSEQQQQQQMFLVKSWEMSGTMQKFYQKWFIWIVTCGSSLQVSKLAKERNNLVILNAVLNLSSWSWSHIPSISFLVLGQLNQSIVYKTIPYPSISWKRKSEAFNSDNSRKKIYKSYPRLLHFQLKL